MDFLTGFISSGVTPAGYICTCLSASFACFIRVIVVVGRNAASYLRDYSLWLFRWDITLSIVTVTIEITSAALEQTFPSKVTVAECGVIMAVVSLILGCADIVYKKHQRRAKIDKRHHHLEWNFADTFGLVFSVLTLISASLDYHYIRNGKPQPIRFSVMPLFFSVCVLCSRIFRQNTGKTTFVMRCSHLGLINLEMESDRDLYGEDGAIQFVCPLCLTGQTHPQGV